MARARGAGASTRRPRAQDCWRSADARAVRVAAWMGRSGEVDGLVLALGGRGAARMYLPAVHLCVAAGGVAGKNAPSNHHHAYPIHVSNNNPTLNPKT